MYDVLKFVSILLWCAIISSYKCYSSCPDPQWITGFDGYIVDYESYPNTLSTSTATCVIAESDLYVGEESVDLFPLKFNYDYIFWIKLANAQQNLKMFSQGSRFISNGADCFQETNDYEFCSTQDPQYVSAPADVQVKTSSTNNDTLIEISWLRPVGPNALKTNSISIITTEHGFLDYAEKRTMDFFYPDKATEDNEERISTTIRRQLKWNITYDLRLIALNKEGKQSIPTDVSFIAPTPPPPVTEDRSMPTAGEGNHTSTIYIILIVLFAVIIACTSISCGYYVRYKRLHTAPQFKRDPDTISVSKGIVGKIEILQNQ
ncbi:uncharacterized protein LOC117109620 isoform X2 [Anneissia japonica]|uniref:uncharacterized protein LOC117109620 isoform X2 n=1 Tax=Anneissia japonica TaxID=1529436 RepID=UPI00142582B8|nr:uncharacterized protein LOC117109620 isoform X2 [Anneissia japonica]